MYFYIFFSVYTKNRKKYIFSMPNSISMSIRLFYLNIIILIMLNYSIQFLKIHMCHLDSRLGGKPLQLVLYHCHIFPAGYACTRCLCSYRVQERDVILDKYLGTADNCCRAQNSARVLRGPTL